MNNNKSNLSGATSYQEMSDFWDEHSLTDYWDKTEPVEFEVNLESESFYYELDLNLANKVQLLAEQRGITSKDLLNLWIQEKLQSEMA